MVMHARKPQRISDGYFEKHQAHPYQVVNQDSTHLKNSKYSSSKANYADRCKEDRERMRDSPNGNSYRSDSPDPHSQSPRYQNKGSFLQKARDKERENRDYRSRDKYSDCVRSPKDKRSRESRDSEHRTNHDRNSSEEKRDDRERERERERDRVVRVGDWSEHLSSSGKKYYYNCKTEVSQWEKPREWVDRARINYNTSTSRSGVLSPVHDKHSNSRGGRSDRDGNNKPQSGGGLGAMKGRAEAYWPSQHRSLDLLHEHDHRNSQPLATTNACAESHSVHSGGGGVGGGGAANTEQDMEICSGESTPTESEGSYCPQQQQGQGAGGVVQEGPGPPPQLQPLKVDTTVATADPGPPTPTHSESQDCTDARKLGSPPSSLSSLQSLTAGVSTIAALRAQGPHLTPGLANHYRDDLVNHVRGWPADVCEKQANKLSEEAHSVGSLQCTRVSAELKSFRSVVRLTEIQATLQEQRILFLRQQIKTLEELKSQNSFMANDC